MAADGDLALVGVVWGDDNPGVFGSDFVAAYVAPSTGSEPVQFLAEPDGTAGTRRFGQRVALSGQRAVIGAPAVVSTGLKGTAWVFAYEN